MLKIEIKTGGAAFTNEFDDNEGFDDYYGGHEVQRILTEVALKIQNGYTEGNCMDINGNKVGTWKLDK